MSTSPDPSAPLTKQITVLLADFASWINRPVALPVLERSIAAAPDLEIWSAVGPAQRARAVSMTVGVGR